MPFVTLNSALADQLLSALCNTLLYSLWQGIVLAALAGLIIVFTKKTSPALRYNLLCAALLLFALATVVTLIMQMDKSGRVYTAQPVREVSVAGSAGTVVAPVVTAPVNIVVKPTVAAMILKYLSTYHNAIVLVWFLIICAKSIQLGMGLQAVYQLKRKQVFEVGKLWENKLTELSELLQISQKIGLLESGMAKVPMVIGHLKPVILIPIGLLTALSADEVEAILIHELAHIRRRDYMVNLLQSLMEVVFFFNPAVLWVSQLIKAERENCCDDIAVAHSSNKMGYIRALVTCQEYQAAVPAYAMAFPGKKNQMVERIKRLVSSRNNSLNIFEKSLLTICLVVAGLCMSAYAEKDHIKQVAHAVVASFKHQELNKQQKENLAGQDAFLNDQENLLRKNTEVLNRTEQLKESEGQTALPEHTADTIKPAQTPAQLKLNPIFQLKEDSIRAVIREKIQTQKLTAKTPLQLKTDIKFQSRIDSINQSVRVHIDSIRTSVKVNTSSVKVNTSQLRTNITPLNITTNLKGLSVHDSVKLETINVKPRINLNDLNVNDTIRKPKTSPLGKLSSPLGKQSTPVAPYNNSAYKAKPYNASGYKPYNADEEKAKTDHMTDELLNDHLITSKDTPLSFKLDDTELIVNGKKVPDDIYQKYRTEYVKLKTATAHWSWMHNFKTNTVTTSY